MKGTIIDCVKYPKGRGGGYGYIVRTDEGKLELWPEEALELEASEKRQQDEDDEVSE